MNPWTPTELPCPMREHPARRNGSRRAFCCFLNTCLALIALLLAIPAQADFRKALEAYQNRDGDKLLAEVRDAVEKKNDDGLMLFLMATNMDAATSDYDESTKQTKSTLRAILPQPKWDELRDLLVQATNNSTLDAQYYLLTKSPLGSELLYQRYSEEKLSSARSANQLSKMLDKAAAEYSERGSIPAMLRTFEYFSRNKPEDNNWDKYNYWLLKLAESNNANAQLLLGQRYLNYECEHEAKHPGCLNGNKPKGYYWLKRAAKSYEADPSSDIGAYAEDMCNLFRHLAQDDKEKLRRSYLWCVMGANEQAQSGLGALKQSGEMKIVSPELDAAWGNEEFNKVMSNFPPPEWIVDARVELAKENAPVFSVYFSNGEKYRKSEYFVIELFSNGRVTINFFDGNNYKDLLVNVSPGLLSVFMKELEKTGFYNWPLPPPQYPTIMCDTNCSKEEMKIILRNGDKARRLYLYAWNISALSEADINKFQIPKEQIAKIRESENKYKKFISRIRMAKIIELVEKFFPLKPLRCGLGSSEEKKQACLQRYTEWSHLAKEGL